jgi:hypothetical protein
MTWTIKSGAVGAIALGRPIPASLHDQLERTYVGEMIADGVPIDGFRLDDPPVLVVIEGGPFEALTNEGNPVPPADQLRAKAATAARGGAPVARLFVHGPGPATAAGLGVGSDLAALRAAYPDIRTHVQPPTRRDDRCAARTGSLPNVGFVFASCEAAEAGAKVVRVDLWPPE